MKVTLEKAIVAEKALKDLSETRLPIKTAYTIGKMLRLIAPESAAFNKQRNDLILELGEKDEGADTVTIKPNTPAWTEFTEKLQELIAVEVELAGVKPILLSAFGTAELTPNMILQLGDFIDMEEEEERV